MRALEVLVFHPAAAPGLAAAMGVHERTARRLLSTLEDEGYLQRGHGTHRQRYVYALTPRLLALAGQLAARLPLVTRGERVVRQLHQRTGLDAYLVIPSYGDVIVIARAGDLGAGPMVAAARDRFRGRQRPARLPPVMVRRPTPRRRERDSSAGPRSARDRSPLPRLRPPRPGRREIPGGPGAHGPDAACRARPHGTHERTDRRPTRDPPHRAPPFRRAARRLLPLAPTLTLNPRNPSTLRITAKDRDVGWIRIPSTAKRMLPADRADTIIRLRGTTLPARWNARRGPPERSGTLYVGRRMLDGLVEANEVLTIAIGNDGRIELN